MQRVVIHQHNVGGFDGGVGAHGAHGDADIRPAQHGSVVDAVSHKRQLFPIRFFPQQLLHLFHFICREQLAERLIQSQRDGNLICHLFGVAGEHHALADAGRFQPLDSFLGMGLYHIGNHNMSGVFAIDGHMDDGPHTVAGKIGNPQPVHQLIVSDGYLQTIHLGDDAVSADFLNVADTGAVNLFSVGPLQAFADGMGGSAFGQRRVFYQLFIADLAVMDGVHLENALGQCAGLIKHYNPGLGERFQIVGTFDQNPGLAGASDSGKEGQRDADDQRAGTAGYQEGESAVNPTSPFGSKSHAKHTHQRRQYRQSQSGIAHGRGIDSGKAGDKILGFGFAGGSIFHQIQNLGHSGFPEFFGGTDLENTGHIDATADDLISGLGLPGQGFSGQRCGVEGGSTAEDNAVDGDLLSGLDHNDTANFHFIRIHLFQRSILLHVGIIGADIHQIADIAPAFAHSIALKPFSDLIEQHHRDDFQVFAVFIDCQSQSAQGGYGHEEVFIEHPPVADSLERLAQNIVADDQVICQIESQTYPPAGRSHLFEGLCSQRL